MIRELKEEFDGIGMSRRKLREFGLLFCTVFVLWAGILLWRGKPDWIWPAGAAVGCLLTAFLIPEALRQPFRYWMLFALALGWVTTRIILTIAYAVIMTPMGLVLRWSGRDLLDERITKDTRSYWKKHEPAGGREQYKKQF